MYTKDEGDRRTILAALDHQGETAAAEDVRINARVLANELRRTPRSGFHLSIELGNAAMIEAADVAEALREIAGRVDDYGPTTEGSVRDRNGNTVGVYTLVIPEPAE